MSTNILLNYKKGGVTHTASDDLESIVYILVWICVLYAGPGTLRKDKHVSNMVLKPWVMVANDTDAVNLGAIKTALKFDPSIHQQLSKFSETTDLSGMVWNGLEWSEVSEMSEMSKMSNSLDT